MHDEMFRDMHSPFSDKSVQRIELTMDECLAEFCDWLNQAVDEQVIVNLFSEVQHVVFIIFTKTGVQTIYRLSERSIAD